METIKVLLFAASPRGTAPLDLSREFREIDEEVRRGAFRDAVELILVPGARPVDLLRKLNENRPQIVHFSSHGNPDELVLESGDDVADAVDLGGPSLRSSDERDMKRIRPEAADSGDAGQGPPQVVSKSALVRVLRSCDEGNLRLVVLNACDTRSQAELLTEVVECVVSMNRAISDKAAIKFAASFYGALAFGRSVKNAFDQGVARLSAEGIAEAETPELVVRAGVDASQMVLVGSTPGKPAAPAVESPFIVPFPRNADFVGRQGDLARLHASLWAANSGPVGIRPAGLTGMGGIGKTQLAVEYAHRHKNGYPDGIFWIDAASPLAEGFARLATDHRLRWADNDRPRDEQIRAAFAELNRRQHALLVLDNLREPAALAAPLLPDCVPEDLRCRLLFTTRRHDLGRFAGVEVTVLPVSAALRLLLRHPSRQAALDPEHPDHEHARAIARMLGRLPLALELAGAYLGKFSGDVSLEAYREGLRSVGALATLDSDDEELTEADLRQVHDPAVAATIGEQWAALEDESSPLLLRVASLFPESSAVPIVRLGWLAGLADEARPGRFSPLRRAVNRLDDACLIERLEADRVRLHPLIREFAAGQTPPDQVDDFRRQCLRRAAAALEHFPTLDALHIRRGVDGLQEDLIAILGLCPQSACDVGARIQALLRLLQREAHNLRIGDPGCRPTLFAQQVRNRAFLLGISPLQATAEERLTTLGWPHFRLLWTASRESPALVRTFAGHHDWVTAVAVTPDGRSALSGSYDCILKLWDLSTGQPCLTLTGHTGHVHAVAILPDGGGAVSGSADGTLRLWDLTTGQPRLVFGEHGGPVYAVAITPDGCHVLSASSDESLRLWDLGAPQPSCTVTRHQDWVTALAVTPDGRHAISGCEDCTLRVWDLGTGEVRGSLTGHKGGVTAVAVTPDGRHALSGSRDRTLRLWDLSTEQLLLSFGGNESFVSALAVTPDGRQAISGFFDGTLKLWDLRTGELVRTISGHESCASAVEITIDGRTVVPDWSSVRHPRVSAVAITSDGRKAISGSRDSSGELRLWDLSTGELCLTLAGHDDEVTAVAVTPDGRHALSAARDRTLRLWSLEERVCRATAPLENAPMAIAVARDGRTVVVGDRVGNVHLFQIHVS